MSKAKLLTAARATIQLICALSISMPDPVYAQDDLLIGLEQSAERLRASAERLQPILDRSQFDLDALLDSQEFDADNIVDFVSSDIGFEIYAGALRGALGTLVSGAGNALDQALLAASLLRNVGYDVVIRRGTLDAVTADRLINRMFSTRASAASPWLESPGTIDDADRVGQAARRQAWISAAEAEARRIENALEDASVKFEDRSVISELRADASDYYWVEYRDGPSDAWQSVHPLFGQTPDIDVEETFSEGIPAERTHKVTIEVIVDQRRGNKTYESNLFSPIHLVGPELTDLSLQITLLPDQLLNGDAPLDTARIAEDTTFIYPIVNGAMPAGARALSLRGFLVPMETLSLGSADYFDTVSERGAQAIDAVAALGGGDEEEETQIAIESLRLRVTFRSPDRSEKIEEREWFSESRDIGEASTGSAEHRRALVSGLSRSHEFSFATGAISSAYFLDPLLDNFKSLQSAIDVAKSIESDDCDTLECLLELDWQAVGASRSSNALFLAFDDIDRAGPAEVVRYRHVPGLYIQSAPVLPQAGQNQTADLRLDIVSNAKRAFKKDNSSVSMDAHRQLRAGIWETQIETDVFGNPDAVPPDGDPKLGSLREVSMADIAPFLKSSSVARAINRDLQNGYAVFANADADLGSSGGSIRWWRVDPTNAETLGMNHYGGAVSTEALIFIAVGLIALICSLGVAIHCHDRTGYGIGACFACRNVITGGLALSFSALRTIGADPEEYSGYFQDEMDEIFDWCME